MYSYSYSSTTNTSTNTSTSSSSTSTTNTSTSINTSTTTNTATTNTSTTTNTPTTNTSTTTNTPTTNSLNNMNDIIYNRNSTTPISLNIFNNFPHYYKKENAFNNYIIDNKKSLRYPDCCGTPFRMPLQVTRKRLDCKNCIPNTEVLKDNHAMYCCYNPYIFKKINKDGKVDNRFIFDNIGYLHKRNLSYEQNSVSNFKSPIPLFGSKDIYSLSLDPNDQYDFIKCATAVHKKSNFNHGGYGAVSQNQRITRLKYIHGTWPILNNFRYPSKPKVKTCTPTNPRMSCPDVDHPVVPTPPPPKEEEKEEIIVYTPRKSDDFIRVSLSIFENEVQVSVVYNNATGWCFSMNNGPKVYVSDSNHNEFDWLPQGQYILKVNSHDENNNLLAFDEIHFSIVTDNPEPERAYGVIHNAMLINLGVTTSLTAEEAEAFESGDAVANTSIESFDPTTNTGY